MKILLPPTGHYLVFFWISLSIFGFSWVRFGHAPKSELLVLSSNPQFLKCHSFRPFCSNSLCTSFQGWRADLSARRARWSQLSLDPAMLAIAMVFNILGMHFSGYPKCVIQRLWQSQVFLSLDVSIATVVLSINLPTQPTSSIEQVASQISSAIMGHGGSPYGGKGAWVSSKGKCKGKWQGQWQDYHTGSSAQSYHAYPPAASHGGAAALALSVRGSRVVRATCAGGLTDGYSPSVPSVGW